MSTDKEPIVTSHALQRFSERLELKKSTIDIYKLMTSRKLIFMPEKSNQQRAFYKHINDNGFVTHYIFNGDSSALITVIPKGKNNNIWITERDVKKLVPFDNDELTSAINWVVPEATKTQKAQLLDLMQSQRTAVVNAFVNLKDNRKNKF